MGLAAATAVVAVALAAPLIAYGADPGRGQTLGVAAGAVGLVLVIAGTYLGFVRPRRRYRADRDVARYVGRRESRIASDLLSSVELSDGPPADRRERVSNELVDALLEQTAERTEKLDPDALVPARPAHRARLAFLSAALVYGAVYLLAPAPLEAGWKRLVTSPAPGPFGDAALSDKPLVGDISIRLEYPPYTKRQPVDLPSASGDVRVMPGTTIVMETVALGPVDEAKLIFGDPDVRDDTAQPAVEMSVTGRNLSARFAVTEPAVYRFLLEDGGERRTERTGHQIEIEPDVAPEVELYAPAEELDVTSLKRIELAYIAEDDYGISKVELVISEDSGDPQRKPLPMADAGRRSSQAKYILDLAEVQLEPGVRVAYHVEVTDNDTVLGPNVGSSKTYYLRVFSPRERHEALVDRQQELFEKMVRLLGGRLVVEPEDLRAHEPLLRDSQGIVIELGGILAALEEDELAAEDLIDTLTAMRARLDGLAKDEDELLRSLKQKQAQGVASKIITSRLKQSDAKQVPELEEDVLLLADWIDRQRLEVILAITDEIEGHQDRLRQLFKEYARTGDPEIKEEIERELRALEKKLAELAQKRGTLSADVMDQFMNADAMQSQQLESCTEEVRALLESGDAAAAQAKMEECAAELDQAAKALEDSLSALRGDKFTEEERKLNELLDDLADLSHDQDQVASDADEIWDRYAKRADEEMRDTAKETRKKLSDTIEELEERLEDVPQDGLTPFAKEELDIVESRVNDLEEMLEDGDIAEALAMAKQAAAGLETMDAELESALDDEPRGPFARRTRDARRGVRKAKPLADEVVRALEKATPSPEEIMTPKDRRALEKLRRQQKSVRNRVERLQKRVEKDADDLPGRVGSEVPKRLSEASEPMQRGEKGMRQRDPSAARQAAREAAEKLEAIRKGAQGAARQQQAIGGKGLRDEPVRIPGADQYKAPEEFREDILEAMKKEGAPEGFSEQVKRYYEELIR